MACDECVKLRATIRELREELAEYEKFDDAESPLVLNLMKALRLRPQSAKILAALLARAGKVVSTELLIESADYEGEASNTNDRRFRALVGVNISRIRRGLEDAKIMGGIVTYYARGHMLTKEAAEKIRALL